MLNPLRPLLCLLAAAAIAPSSPLSCDLSAYHDHPGLKPQATAKKRQLTCTGAQKQALHACSPHQGRAPPPRPCRDLKPEPLKLSRQLRAVRRSDFALVHQPRPRLDRHHLPVPLADGAV